MIWMAVIGWFLFGLTIAEYLWTRKRLKTEIEAYQYDAMLYYRQRRELEVKLYGREYVYMERCANDPRFWTITPGLDDD